MKINRGEILKSEVHTSCVIGDLRREQFFNWRLLGIRSVHNFARAKDGRVRVMRNDVFGGD